MNYYSILCFRGIFKIFKALKASKMKGFLNYNLCFSDIYILYITNIYATRMFFCYKIYRVLNINASKLCRFAAQPSSILPTYVHENTLLLYTVLEASRIRKLHHTIQLFRYTYSANPSIYKPISQVSPSVIYGQQQQPYSRSK